MAVNTSHGTAHETVVLIGASRGLGLALAEEYARRGSQVVATVRGSGPTALHEVQAAASGRIEIEHVDITSQQQVLALRQRLAPRQFNLLFINAGVINGPEESTGNVTTEEFTRLMLTNALAPCASWKHSSRSSTRAARSWSCRQFTAASRTTSGASSRSTGRAKPLSTSSCAATQPPPRRHPNADFHGPRMGENRARRTTCTPHRGRQHPKSSADRRCPTRTRRLAIPGLSGPNRCVVSTHASSRLIGHLSHVKTRKPK